MTIYTRRGDKGTTTLTNGERVSKADERIDYYGSLDELSSQIGWLSALIQEKFSAEFDEELSLMEQAQQLLFHLAVDAEAAQQYHLPHPTRADTEALERSISHTEKLTDGLFSGFVLPGGHPLAAHAHVVRTLCRRTERLWYKLCKYSSCLLLPINDPQTMAYINRLSDFFYALAKKINYLTQTDEKNAR